MAGANEPRGGPGLLNRPKKWGGGSTRLAQKVFHIFAIFPISINQCSFFQLSSYGWTFGADADEERNYQQLTTFRLYPKAFIPSTGGAYTHAAGHTISGGRVEFDVKMSNR